MNTDTEKRFVFIRVNQWLILPTVHQYQNWHRRNGTQGDAMVQWLHFGTCF
jgi:hypothetical protein